MQYFVKGFLGFEEFIKASPSTQLYKRNVFDFFGKEDDKFYHPYRSIIEEYVYNQDNTIGKKILHTENTMDYIETQNDNDKVFFPYIIESITKQYDIDENNTLLSVNKITKEFDTFGNNTHLTLLKGEQEYSSDDSYPFKQEATKTYNNNTDFWIIGQLLMQTKDYYAPNTSHLQFKKELTYFTDEDDYRFGMLESVISEPDNPGALIEKYDYDYYGNKKSITKGAYYDPDNPIEDRTESFVYGDEYNHRFITSSIDPLGNVSNYEYDDIWGLKTKVTDPNNLITQFEYDEFGRNTKIILPDGKIICKRLLWVMDSDPDKPNFGFKPLFYEWSQMSGKPEKKSY